ncbi:hypothetical protein SteCoe_19771 [Stentor coeruleus]|uniref:Uncharacterized protein n=1 Tax=Stentor coeruleus TaxID=5963 RepID=A0A1R2BT97_9CILI|nr:hypothetical protein SteCoe_19771 [Stentor coeruleus]
MGCGKSSNTQVSKIILKVKSNPENKITETLLSSEANMASIGEFKQIQEINEQLKDIKKHEEDKCQSFKCDDLIEESLSEL